MVWFQCEDCGENLKKPKLQNHFRMCSANKLSCIDCGVTFNQQSVQSHSQCITEAEKYGPKGQGKPSNEKPAKEKSGTKQNPDIDINVGLSSRPPWSCRLCNTQTTSHQTLLLHAEGKKHRAKARAFHAAKQQPIQTEELTPNQKYLTNGHQKVEEPAKPIHTEKADEGKNGKPSNCSLSSAETEKGTSLKKKRKSDTHENPESGVAGDPGNGEVIQGGKPEPESSLKKKKCSHEDDKTGEIGEPKDDVPCSLQIKWKKLITSILKSSPDGVLKMKKLQKLVLKSLKESGITQDETQLKDLLLHKVESSSRFMLNKKLVRMVPKRGS